MEAIQAANPAKHQKAWTTADVCEHIIVPATKARDCSFADLVVSLSDRNSGNAKQESEEEGEVVVVKQKPADNGGGGEAGPTQTSSSGPTAENAGVIPSHTTPMSHEPATHEDRAASEAIQQKLGDAITASGEGAGGDQRPLIGRATVFISHAWRFTFAEVAGVMKDMAAEDPSTYFWFDLVCNNQVSSTALPHDFWSNTFASAIQRIGRVAVVLSPWHDPIPLQRSWCLWEINCGMRAPAFEVRVPRSEEGRMREGILSDFSALTNALARIDAERAQATKPSDAEMIAATIREGTGFSAFNHAVKEKLREWYLNTAEDVLTAQPDKTCLNFADACLQVAVVQGQFSRFDAGIANVQRALDIYSAQLGPHDRRAVSAMNNQAGLLVANARESEAKRVLDDAWARLLKMEEERKDARKTQDERKKEEGEKKAEVEVQEEKEVEEEEEGEGTKEEEEEETKEKEGETKEEEETREEGEGTKEGAGGTTDASQDSESEDSVLSLRAALLNNMGKVLDSEGSHRAAAEKHEEAMHSLLKMRAKDRVRIATSINNAATSLHGAGQLEAAAEKHREALALRIDVLTPRHVDVANSHERLGDVLVDLDQTTAGREHYNLALDIKSQNLGNGSADVARLKSSLAKLDEKEGAALRGLKHQRKGLFANARRAIPQQTAFVPAPSARTVMDTNPMFIPAD